MNIIFLCRKKLFFTFKQINNKPTDTIYNFLYLFLNSHTCLIIYDNIVRNFDVCQFFPFQKKNMYQQNIILSSKHIVGLKQNWTYTVSARIPKIDAK